MNSINEANTMPNGTQISGQYNQVRRQQLSTLLSTVFLLTMFLVTGCKKPTVDPVTTLFAHAGADQPVQVGQLVTLDGSASSDGQGKPLTYQWAFTRKPAKSAVTLATPNIARPTFTPDEVGEYELTMIVSNGADTRSDQVLVVAAVAQPLTIDKDITVKTVLEDRIANPNFPDYIVPRDIAVKHELTINPGVVIAFERDVRFDINDNGGLIIAKGTTEKRIRFVGVNQTKGYWAGIMLFSKSNANVFDHVDVLHAGSRTMLYARKMGMAMFKESQIALKNTLFSQNDGYGLLASEDAVLQEFSTNTFSNNTDAGILLSTDNVIKLDAASSFSTGNGRNVVEVNGDYIGNDTDQATQITWGGFADNTPYRLLNTVAVRKGWKLNPGVTLQFVRDASINIDESGYLNAIGTDNRKVRFVGAENSAAYWRGILCYSASAQNQIENAELLNGGSTTIVSGIKANLAIYGNNSRMHVTRTRIGGSGGYVILVSSDAERNADASTSNIFEGNAQANIGAVN